MSRLHELARECSEIALANGFDKPTWENFAVKAMMAVTELDEGVDAVHGHGKDPLDEELADFAIRLLSMLHDMWGDQWCNRIPADGFARAHAHAGAWLSLRFQPVEVLLWRPLGHVCKAVEAWRKERDRDAQGHLEFALKELWRVALAHDIDLVVAIEAKCEKNRGRPKLHGKIRSEA